MEAYEAAMVLSGVGDALGYRAGLWEYCTSGPQIHAELAELGGLEAITLKPPEWPVSDDTILHLATAEGLATGAGEGSQGLPCTAQTQARVPRGVGSPLDARPTVECSGAVGCPCYSLGSLEGLKIPVISFGRHGGGPCYTHRLYGEVSGEVWGSLLYL